MPPRLSYHRRLRAGWPGLIVGGRVLHRAGDGDRDGARGLYGSGDVLLAFLRAEVVERLRWLTENDR